MGAAHAPGMSLVLRIHARVPIGAVVIVAAAVRAESLAGPITARGAGRVTCRRTGRTAHSGAVGLATLRGLRGHLATGPTDRAGIDGEAIAVGGGDAGHQLVALVGPVW